MKKFYSLLLVGTLTVFPVFFAPEIYVNTKPAKDSVENSPTTVNHSTWSELLGKFIDEKGLLKYKAWKSDSDSMKKLNNYLNHLAIFESTSLKDDKERLAYWINFYNAAVVAGVLERYPIESVEKIENFWSGTAVYAGKKEYTLAQLENDVIRSFNEPRIHWAIVRASLGCGRLIGEAYTPDKLHDQLAEREKHYLVKRRQVYVDREKCAIVYSKIFSSYGIDFIKAAGTKLDYVKKYLSEEDIKFIENNAVSTRYIKYDWSLNESKE